MQTLLSQMWKIHLPILIMHGNADQLSSPSGSEVLYDRLSATDKTLKLYHGLYQEIFNEPGHGQVFADMDAWLLNHMRRD